MSNKEQDTLKDMRLVQEMYARGLEFMPIDLYRAKAKKFLIVTENRCRRLQVSREWARKLPRRWRSLHRTDRICSLDDFRQRTKVSKTCDRSDGRSGIVRRSAAEQSVVIV